MKPSILCDAEISAVITRVSGQVIDLGVIDATYELSPAKQAEWDASGKARADERITAANTGGQ